MNYETITCGPYTYRIPAFIQCSDCNKDIFSALETIENKEEKETMLRNFINVHNKKSYITKVNDIFKFNDLDYSVIPNNIRKILKL